MTQPLRLIPPSLLRVRRFMLDMGWRVTPWATAEQVLSSLRDLLHAHREDASFWHDLQELILALEADVRARMAGAPFAANTDVLSIEEHKNLLSDLREELVSISNEGASFSALVRKLCPRSVSSLCMLAAVATASCGGVAESENNGGTGSSAGGDAAATGGAADLSSGGTGTGAGNFASGGSSATGGQNASGGYGGGEILLPIDVPSGGFGGSGTTSTKCPGPATVEEVVVLCTDPGEFQEEVLRCAKTLNLAWTEGLSSLLACKTCEEVACTLEAITRQCADLPPEYLEYLIDCAPVLIYRGVRFD